MSVNQLRAELKLKYNSERAEHSKRFFKTGKGEYGEGDIFLGLTMPQTREIVGKFWKELNFAEFQELIDSPLHEERMIALLILVKRFEKNSEEREKIFNFYLKNTKQINNWDLVDVTAPNIVGRYMFDNERKNPLVKEKLFNLANSENIWKKRISVLATFSFIKNNRFAESLEIAEILLRDKHDLIHKAVGWMLREVGKRDLKIEEKFLNKYYKTMPRTMLRYAIEKFDEKRRKFYMS
jgi:3-methyladenine DNA glycosylase AlkD